MENFDYPKLPDQFYCEGDFINFKKSLIFVESGDWVSLYKCPAGSTYWAIDKWDKYSHQVASRVVDINNWQSATEKQRKVLLLQSRGGLANETCMWANCDKKCVKGSAYCIDHLYATGARK